MKPPSTFPVVIKRGSSSVRIYRTDKLINATTYHQFKVSFYDATGKRCFRSFSVYEPQSRLRTREDKEIQLNHRVDMNLQLQQLESNLTQQIKRLA